MLFCDFLHMDKHENLLQIDAVILMGMIRHSQSSQNSKFATTLYNTQKKLEMELILSMKINIEISTMLVLLLLMEVAKQKYHNCFCVLLWCKTFRYFARVQSCLLLLVLGGGGVVVKNRCSLLDDGTHIKNELMK